MIALLTLALATAPAPAKIAVLDIEAEGVPSTLVATLSLLVPNAVRDANPGAEVMSGAEIRSLIGFERQRQLLGCKEDSSCIAEMGGALGASELVAGSLGKVGKTYVLQLRRLDVAKGRTIASTVDTVENGEDALLQAVRAGIRKLYGSLAPPPPTAGASTSLGTVNQPRWPGYALTAVGGAALVTGLIAAGIAADQYSTLSQAHSQWVAGTLPTYPTQYANSAPGLKGESVFADWMTIGGALVAAGGVVWILRTPSSSLAMTAGPGSVAVAGAF